MPIRTCQSVLCTSSLLTLRRTWVFFFGTSSSLLFSWSSSSPRTYIFCLSPQLRWEVLSLFTYIYIYIHTSFIDHSDSETPRRLYCTAHKDQEEGCFDLEEKTFFCLSPRVIISLSLTLGVPSYTTISCCATCNMDYGRPSYLVWDWKFGNEKYEDLVSQGLPFLIWN